MTIARFTGFRTTACSLFISGLNCLLHSAVLGSAIFSFLIFSGIVQAQDDATASAETDTRVFDIPAGPLDSALDRFARTAGVNLTYDAALVSGATTRGLSGRHSVSTGLMLLLVGRGVTQSGGGYALRKAQGTPNATARKTLLPTMTVSAAADTLKQGTAEEGYRVSEVSGVGLWDQRSLLDTPYSMSVVISDLIENVNAQNMGQIFKMNPLTQEPIIQNHNGVPLVYHAWISITLPGL